MITCWIETISCSPIHHCFKRQVDKDWNEICLDVIERREREKKKENKNDNQFVYSADVLSSGIKAKEALAMENKQQQNFFSH